MTNYDELKKAAEAATPGPWEWPNKGSSDFVIAGPDRLGIGHLDSPRTAEYVALANPTAILALLAEHEQQAQRINELEAYNTTRTDELAAAARRIAELEAENTNLKYRLGVMIETAKQGSEHRAELQQQRDELLAALEKALAALETCTPVDYSTGHVIHASFDDAACAWAEETARAAIVKVKP